MNQSKPNGQKTEIFAFDFKGNIDPANSSFPSIELIRKILTELTSDEDRGIFVKVHNQYIDSQIHDAYPEYFESSQVADPSFEIKQKRFFNLREQFRLSNIAEESGFSFDEYWRSWHYLKWFLFMLGNSKGGDSQSLIRLKRKMLKASKAGVEIGKIKFKWSQYIELEKYEEYKHELLIFDGVYHYLDWFDLKGQIIESILSSIENIVDVDKDIHFELNNIPNKIVSHRLFAYELEIIVKMLKAYARCIEYIDKNKELRFSYLQFQIAIYKAANLFLWFEPFYRFKELRLSCEELEIQLIEFEQIKKSEEKDGEVEKITATGFRCPFCHRFRLIPVGGKSFAHCGAEECSKQYSSLTSQKHRESPSVLNQNPLQGFFKRLPKAFDGQRKRCECQHKRVLYQFEGENLCKKCITETLADRGFQ